MELSQQDLRLLGRTRLFQGISPEKLRLMLACLGARQAQYPPGGLVLREGDEVEEVGVVLAGRAQSLGDAGGPCPRILTLLEEGSFIGVLLAASRGRASPVTVQAKGTLRVLFLPARRIAAPCGNLCPEHGELLRNYLDAVAEKSLVLHDRIDCLSRRGVRDKVLAYLARTAREQGSREFTIPLDRSGLADYLNVERSALSRELSRMKEEGLIQYRKNWFHLL